MKPVRTLFILPVVGVGCALVGFVGGRMSLSENRDVLGSDSPALMPDVPEYAPAGQGRLQSLNRPQSKVLRDVDDSATGEAEVTSGGKMVWVSAELLDALSEAAGMRSAGQSLFGVDGKVEELLQVTDQEKAAIQSAWKRTQEKLRELEVSRMYRVMDRRS